MEETAVLNESVSLPCVAIGNPAANITWEWKGKKVVESPRVVVGPNGSLIIENVTRKDEGVYTCTPRNKWPGEKKTTKLVVLGECCGIVIFKASMKSRGWQNMQLL